MAYGAFQTSVARMATMAVGAVLEPQSAFIDDKKVVETTAGIGVGVLVSRGTNPQTQVVVGVSTVPLGITCRSGDVSGAVGSEVTNLPVYKVTEACPVLRSGQMPVYLAAGTGSGSAGSTALSVTDATGVLQLGAASQAGESDVTGVTLETTMTGAGIALVTVDADSFGCTAYSG